MIDDRRQPADVHHWSFQDMTTNGTSDRRAGAASSSVITRLSPLDILIGRYARAHEHHVAPLVGCYLCLVGAPRVANQLRAAA